MIVTSHATALVRMPLAGKRAKLLAEAFKALALASNNLANVAIEIASRVLESHREGELMPEAVLTERQKAALKLANAAIDKSNATREAKNERKDAHNAKLAPGEEPKSPSRIFPHFGADGSKAWNIIDISVLDQACRLHRDESGGSPYEAMGSQEAPLVVASVIKAFAKYRKGEAGRPHPRASGASRVVEFPGRSLERAGGRLPPLSKQDGAPRPLFLDRAKTLPLSKEAREAYERIDCGQLLAKFRKGLRAGHERSRFLSMRLTHKGGQAWLEGVFELETEIPDDSLMARGFLASEAAKEKKAADKAKKLAESQTIKAAGKAPGVKNPEVAVPAEAALAKAVRKLDLSKGESDGLLAEILAMACRDGAMPSVAGLDLGVTNLATAAFSNGRKAAVFSGAPFERALRPLDAKINARKSVLAKAPAIAAILAQLASASKAAEAEAAETAAASDSDADSKKKGPLEKKAARLDWELRAAHARDAILQGFEAKRACVVRDGMHQLSSAVAELMAEEGVQAVVVGRNAGWKEGSNMGREQNRRFHSIPHAAFVKMLRHKLASRGIMLVEVEESYTSEASFASSEPLKAHSGVPAKAKAPKASKSPKAAKGKPSAHEASFARDSAAEEKRAAAAANKAQKQEKSRAAKQAKAKIQKEQRKNGAQMARDAGGPKAPPAPGQARTAWPEGDRRPGRRVAVREGASKNRFDTQGQGRWSQIHADANGAYNILRKACPGFRRHAGLSSSFEIMSTGPEGLWTIQTHFEGQRASAKKEAA